MRNKIIEGFEIRLGDRSVLHLDSGLVVDLVEDSEAKGVWQGQPRNPEIYRPEAGDSSDISKLVRNATEAFIKAWKAEKYDHRREEI